MAFLVRVPKTRRAAVKSVLFSPLALLELEWNARPAAGLQHVRNAKPYVVFASIPYDPPKTCIALFIAEFLCAALKAPQPDEGVFGFVETSVRWLDAVGMCQLPPGVPAAPVALFGCAAKFRGLRRGLLLRPAERTLLHAAPAAQPCARTRRGGTVAQTNAHEIRHGVALCLYARPAQAAARRDKRILFAALAVVPRFEIARRAARGVRMTAQGIPLSRHALFYVQKRKRRA